MRPATDRFRGVCAGVTGLTVENPADVGAIVDAVLAAAGPVIVEAIVDPFTPPMPPKISAAQAATFAEALAKGQPHRGKIALTVLSDKVRESI
jgi:pyruvate dehydrogenase (quinone)